MKVLLISANTATSPYPVYPLGLSLIAAVLARDGHEVELFDVLQHERAMEALAEAVRAWKPALVGISIRNIDNVNLLNEQRYIHAVRDIVAAVRRETEAKIVLGGSGFSLMPEAVLRETAADFGIVGEGEQAMIAFVRGAAENRYPAERLLRAPPTLQGRQIPSALYDPRIMPFYLRSGNVATVQTKRGCPHGCIYCAYPVLEGAGIRPRDAKAVVDDVEHLASACQARFIFFADSVFNDPDGHYQAVVEEMRRRGVRMPWTAFFKPDAALDDAAVERMRETGLQAVELGADAASDATLRGLGKDFTFDDVRRCSNLFVRHGIPVAHYYMFGGPGETPATVREGIENIAGLNGCAVFVFMGIRILPATALYELACREGVITSDQDLLDPVYYIAPGIAPGWLKEALTHAFKKLRHVVFPPDALDDTLRFLHKLGYTGSMWDLLLAAEKAPRARRRRGTGTECDPDRPLSA